MADIVRKASEDISARVLRILKGSNLILIVVASINDDHIILFIPNKRDVRAVEKLFQVSATFFG